jgi:hypothetical protein
MKFIATATRKNVDGKPDYRWVFKHTNGHPVTFNSEREALDCARDKCDNLAHALYNPKAELLQPE